MAKNQSAARARDGGQAQESAVPSNGNPSPSGMSAPDERQKALGNSSTASDTDVAAGTGESFDKMLADEFQSTHGLKVTSSQDGFRRAGRAWSTTPTVIALSEFSQEEFAALEAESTLSIRLVRLDDEDA